MPEQLTVLFRDEHIVVIDKPPGLLVYRSEIDRTKRVLPSISGSVTGRSPPTMLFTLTNGLAGALGRQFAAGTMEKTAERSHPRRSAGRRDHQSSTERQDDPYVFSGMQSKSSTDTQATVMNYRKLAEIELLEAVDRYPCSRYALLEFDLVTGRRMEMEAPVSGEFAAILSRFGWDTAQ